MSHAGCGRCRESCACLQGKPGFPGLPALPPTAGNYVNAYSSQNQFAFVAGIMWDVTYNHIPKISGWNFIGPSTFECTSPGLYFIRYMAQADCVGSGQVSMIAVKNGAYINQSMANVTFVDPGPFVQTSIITQGFEETLAAGDLLKIQFVSNNVVGNGQLTVQHCVPALPNAVSTSLCIIKIG